MESHIFNEEKKRFEPRHKDCLFCKIGSSSTNVDKICYYPVYNIQDRMNIVVFRNVKYDEVKVGIPRCENCMKKHATVKSARKSIPLLGIPLAFIAVIYLNTKFDINALISVGILLATIVSLGLISFFGENFYLKSHNILNIHDGAQQDPLIQEFLKNGWVIERPTA